LTRNSKWFYYDVDFEDQKITEADFKKIEDRVLEISRGKHEFKLRPVSKAEALDIYTMFTKQK
jgi:threonyl-tRNA synthetase